MEKIDIGDISVLSRVGFGTDSVTAKCSYNNEELLLKKFKYPYEILARNNMKKLESISNLNVNNSITPIDFVISKSRLYGYTTQLGESIDTDELDYNERIKYLTDIKKSVIELHSKGVIHADIHKGNIINYDGQFMLIDFDNSTHDNYKTNIDRCSDMAKEYIEKKNLNYGIDIYLLNLLTFSLLNECGYFLVRSKICAGEYGIFNTKDSIAICDSLLLESNSTNSCFLIDEVETCKK